MSAQAPSPQSPVTLPNYPFSAVAGQASFKLALILAAINPAIGGVLVSGPRGSAKSTLARGLADIMPGGDDHEDDHSFVTLPLGASEEKLLGSLNLQQVLNERKVEFQPGLLAKADGGILYVDEVNLLQDNLVDLLLDVAASGVNVVERDGISHRHRAQFILLGTMNPDEGELRPQLQDRFGFSVELDNRYSVDERIEIVRLREAFDDNQQNFVDRYAKQQDALTESILNARRLKPQIQCPESLRKLIAEKCDDAKVDGLRADIVWYRAALAHAAWKNRVLVEKEDVLGVEELVLSHRRKNDPSDMPRSSDEPQSKPKPFSRPPEQKEDRVSSNDQHSGIDQDSRNTQGDWGQMDPVQQRTAERVNVEISTKTASDIFTTRSTLSAQILPQSSNKKGSKKGSHKGGGRKGEAKGEKVDWFSTLISNKGNWPPNGLDYHKDKTGEQTVHLVLLDTSASTLQDQVFSMAKAVMLSIAEQAYLAREQLAILGFGNQQVDTLLPVKRAPKMLRNRLDNISAGGGTPLREVLQQAYRYQCELLRKIPKLTLRTYLITDGRTTQPIVDIRLLGDVIVVDSEQATVKRGKARQIAQALDADYFPLPV